MLDKDLQRVKISQVVGNQIPDIIAEDNPLFVEFLQEYYRSQEHQGGPADLSENIDVYLNLENFQQENFLTKSTTLTADCTYYDDVLYVKSTESWPNEYGLLKIGQEIISYTGKTDTSFTGCIRGFSGIESLHKTNDPEFLVFSSTESSDHQENDSVINLSNLFLQEFWKKIKTQFLPGFENRTLYSGLDRSFFLSRAKDFYQTKGTEESVKILFKILYADKAKLIRPQEYVIKPSNADWLITQNLVLERISGDPTKLHGQTLIQDSPSASAYIYDVELYSIEGTGYYIIKLSEDSIEGEFSLVGFTRNTAAVSTSSKIITVDSTLGFDDSGSLYVNGQQISYTEKSSTQFKNCSGITSAISNYSEIYQNKFVYSYEDGDTTKKVEMRISGTLKEFDKENTDAKYVRIGEEIGVKYLGERVKDSQYNNKFDKWVYNPSIDIKLIDGSGKFTSLSSPTFVTTKIAHKFKRGDSVSLISDSGTQVNGTVSDVIYSSASDRQNDISTRFEFAFTSGSLVNNIGYVARRNILTATSGVSTSVNGVFANIQNTYIDKEKNNIYIAATGLPSYEIVADSRSKRFSAGTLSDTVTSTGNHNFYTGQKVFLTSETGNISGLSSNRTYYVKKITDTTLKLATSPSRVKSGDYIEYSGIGTHVLTPLELYGNSLQDQKLLKKLPLTPERKTEDIDLETNNYAKTFGMFLNGVEILSNASKDAVYYGQLNSIGITNSGSGYDVINPPSISITDDNGSGATAIACMSGSIEEIVVTDPGHDFINPPAVKITGGNGKGATAEARLKGTQFSINFDASVSGINTSLDTIGFSTYHSFENGDRVIYKNLGNTSIGIGSTVGNLVADAFLINNSTYFIRKVSDTVVQLMNTEFDALSGINTIPINQVSTGTHQLIDSKIRKTIDFIQVLNPGEGYQNRQISIPSRDYPPLFPGISTAIAGINTADHYIFAKGHGFETGEEIVYTTTGTAISGLSTTKEYYALKLDDSKFRIVEKIAGISTLSGVTTAFNQNIIDNNYVKLETIGSGTHTFNYPPITVTIDGNVNTKASSGISTQAFAYPIAKGFIKDVYLVEGGSSYGAEIINFDKQPTITASSGSGAILRPIVTNGEIVTVFVADGGTGYVSEPNLIVGGIGKFAKLRARISGGSITSVDIIDGGIEYDSNTTVTASSLGSGARFFAEIQKWTVNSFAKYAFGSDDGILIESQNQDLGNQFVSVYAPKKLRRALFDNLDATLNEVGINTVHSPIIGWAYDGNPVYGPYGGNTETSSLNPRLMSSGYTLISKPNRPSSSEFPSGFFVQDFTYTASGDLDEYNGRFCVTPEFPNGTYAYFATRTNYPYTLNGFKYKVEEFNYNVLNNQDIDLLNSGDLLRNTTPYKITESDAYYRGLNDFNNKNEKFVVNSIETSGISSVRIIEGGSNYKVGDDLVFDNTNTSGRGASAEVELLSGKEVTSISYSESVVNNVAFNYQGSTVTGISTVEHNLKNNDKISVSGISSSSAKFLEGIYTIGVSSVTTSLLETIGSAGQTGIVTSIKLVEPVSTNRISVNDIIGIGTEKLQVLSVNAVDNTYRVLREYNSTVGNAHTAGDSTILHPRKFTYTTKSNNSNIVIRENVTTYFNPETSVGFGTLGTRYFVGYGVSFISTGITTGTTTRVFFNSHSFSPSEYVQIQNGTPSGINTNEARVTSVGSTFINLEFDTTSLTGVGNTFNVLKKNYNFVPAKSIYIPGFGLGAQSTPFQTYDAFVYNTNSGIGISVSKNIDLSNPFNLSDNQELYIDKLTDNTIGIRTSRSSTSNLYIVGLANNTGFATDGGVRHSLTTVNKSVQGKVTKFESVVATKQAHGISTSNTINLSVLSNSTESVTLKYNHTLNKLIVNAVSFNSSAIGIGTTVSNINLPSHNFKSGDKVVYESTDPASSLINHGTYYVIKDSDDYIRLSKTYNDSVKTNPVNVAITTTGSGTHELGLINPKLDLTKGNTVGFAVSNNSLLDTKLKFYLDSDFKNEYSAPTVTRTGTPGDTSASTKVNIKLDANAPKILYYALEETNLSSGDEQNISVDDDVKDYSKLIVNDSVYQGEFVASGVGTTSFTLNITERPENTYYTSSNTSQISYTTNSTSATGGINKIKVLYGGVKYKKVPDISDIDTTSGSSAILRSYSDTVGKIKNISPLNIGYNYSSDRTIAPKADIPTILEIKNNYTLESVGITSGGSGYLSPPLPIVVGYPNISLESKLTGSSVSRVNILISDGGLSEVPPSIIATNNSNGITVTNAESDGASNTLTLRRPNNGFVTFPFAVGDKIFVEGATLTSPVSQGGGYNSSDYNYQLFTVKSFINDANVSSVTYDIPVGLGTTGGVFDSNNSACKVINNNNLAKFTAVLKEQNFDGGETISSSNGIVAKVSENGWDPSTKLLRVFDATGDFTTNTTIFGYNSKSKGTIYQVDSFDGNFIVGPSVRKENGWQNSSGVLDTSDQRIHDNFYYQNFSYSIKSTTPYSTWEEPVNALTHTAGFKNFSDLDIFSDAFRDPVAGTSDLRVSVASSELSSIVNLDNLASLYTRYCFDIGSEETTSGGISKYVIFNNKKIVDYTRSQTNKVLVIDDISPQFTGFTTTVGGEIVGLTSFRIRSLGQDILFKVFNSENNSIISAGSSIITISGHDFSTGEKIVYDPGNGSAVAIATTSRTASGVSTDRLPTELYVYKVDDNNFKVSGIKTDATVNNLFFQFRSLSGVGLTVGAGTSHSFSVDSTIADPRVLITVDNIIQSPLSKKSISVGLATGVGAASTTITLSGITSIASNTLLQIDSEILSVRTVGLGSTNVLLVNRGKFDTVSAAHTVGAAVTVLQGDYKISKGHIYFSTAPYGPVGFTTLNPGISTHSTFAGRAFYRKNYDKNYIFDDISHQFTGLVGTGKSFVLLNDTQNLTGISTHNGIILINNIFQRPVGVDTTTDYELIDDGVSGITTISFTGSGRESLPRKGIINEVEVGVGTGYTGGSYSYRSLTGGSGSGAIVDVVVGVGGSLLSYNIVDRGMGYKENEVLQLSSPSVVGIGSTITFTVKSVYTDKFAGWTFGQLIKIDDFSNEFDGVKRIFTLTRTTNLLPEPYSIESSPGSGIVLQNNLLVFINDVLQIPGKDYFFTGGTKFEFAEAPRPSSKLKILFYQGSSGDVISETPLQSIKVGDTLKLESARGVLAQFDRTVIDLTSSDKAQTNDYNDIGISTDPNFNRCITWTKQTSDLIIGGEIISKARDYLEPRVYPATKLIKDLSVSDSEIYVEHSYPEYRVIDNTLEGDTNITIIKESPDSVAAKATVSSVSAGGSITSLTLTSSGSGYITSPDVGVYSQSQVLEVGKTWVSGVTTTINQTILRDIKYDGSNFMYLACDENGGISTSTTLSTWTRTTPSFTTNNQLNSVAFGSTTWVGVGSDAKVGYSTNYGSNWSASTIYSYVAEPGGLGRWIFTPSSTTRKFVSVAYGRDKFVAVGTGGTVLVSDNVYPQNGKWLNSSGTIYTGDPAGIGTVWLINIPSFVDTLVNPVSNVTNNLNSVIYSSVDDQFVAVGNSGVIISSVMGSITNRQFTVVRPPSSSNENLNDIVYGKNKYVVVGDNGTVGFSTLLNGPWITNSLGSTDDFYTVTFSSNVFVASGENGVVANSLDGVNWSLKTSVSDSLYSLTDNGSFVVGVGSTSKYYTSDGEKTSATITANVSASGNISSLTIVDGGFGYISTSDVKVIISPQSTVYEHFSSVNVEGDYGKIVSIASSATGIGTNTPMLIFSIQSDVGLNTNRIAASSQLNPFIERSGITTGDYYVARNTVTGLGVTSILVSTSVSTVGVGTSFIDNIYRADQVDNNGVSGIVTVYSNVLSIVGVATTSVTLDSVGFDTTGRVGTYSWGRMFNFDSRTNPISFTVPKHNGLSGIETSPTIVRRTALKAQYE